MTSWPLFALYIVLLLSPLLLYVATKPAYEKSLRAPVGKKPPKHVYKHSAKH